MTAKVPNPIRKNLDYGEGWTKKVDEARGEDCEPCMDIDDGEAAAADGESKNWVNPTETAAYCGSRRNKEYWHDAKRPGEGKAADRAAKDYEEYVREVRCSRHAAKLAREASHGAH